MKKNVIMIGIAAMLFSLTSFLFALDIPAEKMSEGANFYRKNFSEPQKTLPTGWETTKGTIKAHKENETISYMGSCLWTGISDAYITGDSLWCSFLDGLSLFDISDISSPEFVDRVYTPFSSTTTGSISGTNDILVEGDYAYIGDHTGIRIININDMELISTYLLGSRAHDLYIRNDLLYVAAGSGLLILDIQNPEVPDSVGFYAKPYVTGIDMVGNYAYLSDTGGTGLTILDISSPENPSFVSNYTITGYADELTIANGYAFLADYYSKLEIIDVNDPYNPVYESSISTSGAAYDVKVEGDYAFVAAVSAVDVVDISNVNAPSIVESYTTDGSCKALCLDGNLLLASEEGYLEMLNVQDPTNPSIEGSIARPYWLQEVRVLQDCAYIADIGEVLVVPGGLKIVDLSNPNDPFSVGEYSSGGMLAMPQVLDVSGNYVYIPDFTTTWINKLQIIDVSDPGTPVITGGYQAEVTDVYVSDTLAYLLVSNTFRIVNVQDPLNPTLISSLTLDNDGLKIYVDDGYAYVAADGESTLWIVDINDSSNPQVISTLTTLCDYTRDIFVENAMLYLICNDYLQIVDVSDANNPSILGSYDELYLAYGVYVKGDYAYVADKGILKIDVSNPSTPLLLEEYQVAGSSYGITGVGNYLYLTTESSFMILYDEYSSITGDFNGDSYVGATDLQMFGDHWHFEDTDPNWEAMYDLDPDGIIDAADLQIFGNHWHEGTPPTLVKGDGGKGPNADAGIVFDLDATTSGNQNLTHIDSQTAGSYIRLDVYATGVHNLDTYEFEVVYDSTELEYVSSAATNPITYEENILTTNGSSAVGWMVDDSTPGILSIAYTLTGADTTQAPEGEGLLADIVFKSLVTTHGTLSFGDVYYYDTEGVSDLITDTGTATLPVELSALTATYDHTNGYTSIEWTTASETDVLGFNVYRSDEDVFDTSKKLNRDIISGHGTTAEMNSYEFIDLDQLNYGTTYYYWLESVEYGGISTVYTSIHMVPSEGNGGYVDDFESNSLTNYPNPIRNSTTISYSVKGMLKSQPVEINIYNMLGQLVDRVEGRNGTATWNTSEHSTGIYFYKLNTDSYTEIRKMMVVHE